METSIYQKKAMLTNDGKCSDRVERFIYKNQLPFDEQTIEPGELIMAALGLSGESGEVADLVKKWIFHEKPTDIEHLKKELGDCMWYLALACRAIGTSFDEIMALNIAKLKARYPEGFSVERANNRAEGDV